MRSVAVLGMAGALAAFPVAAGAAPQGAAAPSSMSVGQAGGWSSVGWRGAPAAAPAMMPPPPPPMGAPPPPPGHPPMGMGNGHPGGPPPGGFHHGHGWGNWAGGGAYHRPHRGGRLSRYYVVPDFYIDDWGAYGLGAPGEGLGWYRYYDDAVLAGADGEIYGVTGGIDWDRADRGPGYGQDYGAPGYGAPGYGAPGYGSQGYAGAEPGPPPPPHHRHWHQEGGAWRSEGGYGWAPPPGPPPPLVYQTAPGTTTVVIQSAPVVTRTTTVEDYVVWEKRRVWKPRPRVKWPKPACGCGCVCR